MTKRRLGHYEILEKLGEGGMGVVYKARDLDLDRLVAIKVLPAARVGDADSRTRFMQEARAASALNHPNIITVYEVGTDGDDIYIAMELVEGKALDQSIPAGGMKARAALEAAIQVTDALAKAHAAGIVHRDLKPGNIMLAAEGRVKLLDFGLAKLIVGNSSDAATRTQAALTQDGAIVGTAAYMSPEQAEGRGIDGRSDIFSFGAVLYEMLCGRRAFEGSSVVSTLAAVLEKDPAPMGPVVPRAVERIVSRCLRKEPGRRYQHAGDVRIGLEDALADLESGTSSGSLPAAVAAPRRVAGWLWPAVAGAVIAAGAAWWLRPAPDQIPSLELRRLTGDGGLTTAPAISPDGKLIAYASDRAGNGDLDIWVQHRGGGEPVRVTKGAGDEIDPSFSADGSQIVYATLGSIWIVPALGGEPRKIGRGEHSPRLSPDGKRLVVAPRLASSQISLQEIGKAQLRPFGPNSKRISGPPAWSPDGRHLLLTTIDGREVEWWLVPVDTLQAVSLGKAPGLAEQWLGGDRILYFISRFGKTTGSTADLGLAEISLARGKIVGWPQRLTNNISEIEGVSVAADGTFVVAGFEMSSNLWSLPFDANSGRGKGNPEQLTQNVALTAYPAISTDGMKLAFQSDADGRNHVWMMDVTSRRRRRLTTEDAVELRPELSPDGKMVAYSTTLEGKRTFLVSDVTSLEQPGTPRQVCTAECAMAWAWSGGNLGFLVTMTGFNRIGFVSANGGVTEYAQGPGSLWQAHPSPDGNWMMIMDSGDGSKMKVARLNSGKMPDRSQWKSLTKGGGRDLYRWSPDGNVLYFISAEDKFRCIWGLRLNPATKDPVGEPFAVYHSHGARHSMMGLGDSGAVGLAVARDRIVFAQAERTADVWLGKLPMK